MKLRDLTRGTQYAERRFGMEIEVEYCNRWPDRWFWERTEDGSLRNGGMEFISQPWTYEELVARLDEFYAKGFKPFNWRSTKRTGIHLHMDTSLMDMDQLGAFLTAYAALEPVLFNVLCGPDREENIYCVPWYRAREQALYVQAFLNMGDKAARDDLVALCGRVCKYSALYLEPLRRYGTVEFRGAPTFTSAEESQRFVQTFDTLLDLTGKDGTAKAVMDRFENINDATRYYLPHLEVPDADLMVLRADSLGIADLFVPDLPKPAPAPVDSGEEWVFPEKSKLTQSAYKALVGARAVGRYDELVRRAREADAQVRIRPGRMHIRPMRDALLRDVLVGDPFDIQIDVAGAPPRPQRRG